MLEDVDLDLNCELIDRNKRVLQAVWNWEQPEVLPINYPARGHYGLVPVEKKYSDFESNLYAQVKFQKEYLDKGFVFLPAVARDFNHALCPSAFGCRIVTEEAGIPFEVPAFDKTPEAIEDLTVPSLDGGLVRQCLDDTRTMRDMLPATIAIAQRTVHGPVDLACKVRGMTEFYLDLYERPQLAHRLLGVCTEFLIRLIKAIRAAGRVELAWNEVHADFLGHCESPGVNFSDDSAVNLSPETYQEFARPHNEKLLKAFGDGGMLHSCGKNEHLHDIWQEMDCVKGVELDPEQVDVFQARSTLKDKIIWTAGGHIHKADFDDMVDTNLRFVNLGGAILHCGDEQLLHALKRRVGER